LQHKNADEMAAELRFSNAQKQTDKMIQDFLKQRAHIRDEVHEAIGVAKLVQVDQEFKEFHRRRAEQLAEVEVTTSC
jgi:hypothetical protein